MVKIGKSFTFEAAHRLQNHEGKCFNLHGHSYKIEVSIKGKTLVSDGPERGMLLDFGTLDEWWRLTEPRYDHMTLLEESDPIAALLKSNVTVNGVPIGLHLTTFPWPPTAEHLAKELADSLEEYLIGEYSNSGGLDATVRVYETAKSWAEAKA